jgi:hypothetical protein
VFGLRAVDQVTEDPADAANADVHWVTVKNLAYQGNRDQPGRHVGVGWALPPMSKVYIVSDESSYATGAIFRGRRWHDESVIDSFGRVPSVTAD